MLSIQFASHLVDEFDPLFGKVLLDCFIGILLDQSHIDSDNRQGLGMPTEPLGNTACGLLLSILPRLIPVGGDRDDAFKQSLAILDIEEIDGYPFKTPLRQPWQPRGDDDVDVVDLGKVLGQ